VFHVRQSTPQLYFGDSIDWEYEGNGGLRFGAFLAYDADECGPPPVGAIDRGLVAPQGYTIQSGVEVSCDAGPPPFLGGACDTARLGTDFDLLVTNDRAQDAFLNVLVDWDRNGIWLGEVVTCQGTAPEWAIRNLPVSPTGATPTLLSTLASAAVPLGPDPGYVWVRFTLSDLPVTPPGGLDWDGSNASADWTFAPIGETEDYLLRIDTGAVGVADAEVAPPPTGLAACAPNPFTDRTAIRFALAHESEVQVAVYDVRGRLVRTLVTGRVSAGAHAAAWDGATDGGGRAPAGIYFVQMRADGVRRTRKLALQR
jgi:hypothetical protein